jgi:hypothetical protein
VALARGLHPITVAWFNKEGGAELALSMAEAGQALEPVGEERLRRAR